MPVIETERLIIRPVGVEDAEAIFKWASDPEVTKYMIYPTHPNIEVTKKWLAGRDINGYDEYDLGFVLKETGELVGMGGMNEKVKGEWTIGYNLRKDQWGKGIVPEAIKAIIDCVEKEKGIKKLKGEVAEENLKSQRVMDKLGLKYCGEGDYEKFDHSAHFHAKLYEKVYE